MGGVEAMLMQRAAAALSGHGQQQQPGFVRLGAPRCAGAGLRASGARLGHPARAAAQQASSAGEQTAAAEGEEGLGVDGFGQPGSGGWFDWVGYLVVAAMVRDAGLDLRILLNAHGAVLPECIADAAAADPDVLTDRASHRRDGLVDRAPSRSCPGRCR